MLSRDLGGVQQASLDYSIALQTQNIETVNITSLYAKINDSLDSRQQNYKLPNLGPWDFLSVLRLMVNLKRHNPDVIIAHGNRAISFALKARAGAGKKVVIAGVAHNYSTKWLQKCDHIIVLTNHMKQHLLSLGIPDYRLHHIPNMINLGDDATLPLSKLALETQTLEAKDAENLKTHKAREDLSLGVTMQLPSRAKTSTRKFLTKKLHKARHCERSEAIQLPNNNSGSSLCFNFITGLLRRCLVQLLAMTPLLCYFSQKISHEGLSSGLKFRGESTLPARNNQSTEAPLIIGTFARFVKKKAIDLFLESLAILKSKGYNFKAIIGGDGEEKQALLNLTKKLGLVDQVKFTGWVEDKRRFFSEIDIFCLPSRHEPFGIILLEAMLNKVPVVATKTEGPLEILRNNQDGLLAEIDPNDFADKIAYLIDNKDKAVIYSNNAYLRLMENYVIDVVSQKLAEFLTLITKNSKNT